ncbi:MAG: DegV family protein [Metamycoplasmataceae bacterium]
MKLAIVVDSSCGLTKKQAEKRGWFYLPLNINIDGIEYRDGIDITSKNFYSIYKKESKVSTTATPPGEILDLFKKLNQEFDFTIVYPISEGLSSQYQTLLVLAKNFPKIHIIKSKNVSISIVDDLIKLENDINNNDITYKQGIERIESDKPARKRTIHLIPKHNDALLNGGRLTPSAAKLAKLFKIIPIIVFNKDGKLDKYSKGRIFDRTVMKLFDSLYLHHSKNLGNDKLFLFFLDVNCSESEKLKKYIEEKTHCDKNFKLVSYHIPPIIAIHTGLESISLQFDYNNNLLLDFLTKEQ